MAKKSVFGIISLLFIISIGGTLPLLYFNLIEPRLGVMNAHIGISALEISAVDDLTMTFVIKLKILDPSGNTIVFPKLDLTAFAGFTPLGIAWNPTEWVIDPLSYWLLDYNAILYLRVIRGEEAGITKLFDALLKGSDLPITLSGDALIGSLPFTIPAITFSLGGVTALNPAAEIIKMIEEELQEDEEEEEEDLITLFLNYIQANGVDLEELTNTVGLDAEGLLEFLDSYGINVFSLFYYLDVGQEWYEGFTLGNNSGIENREDRIGVEQAINAIENANPDVDIYSNLLKIAWDLDDDHIFNGTPFSRGNITAPQPYFDLVAGPSTYYFNQSRNPELFYGNLLGVGVNYLMRETEQDFLNITPNRNGTPNYLNNASETWTIIPHLNTSITADKHISYMKFLFEANPFLDIEGDGNTSTFDADNLTFSYLDIQNNSNPVSLTYDEDNILEFDPLSSLFCTPYLPTNSVVITFKSNGSNTQTGFNITYLVVDEDTPFPDVHVGNYTPSDAPICFNLDNDTIDAEHKENFNPTAFLIFTLWHTTYILNQSYGIPWEDAWQNVTFKGLDVMTLLLSPPTTPIDNDWTSDGMSFWDLLWWVNYHYDVRYLLNISSANEIVFLFENLGQLMSPLNQADFFYGDVTWNNGTHIGLLKDIVPDFPTMSPAHAFVDFAPGAQFENMSEPLNYIKIWERNPTTGKFDDDYTNYTHLDLYGVSDIPGTGGPYAADSNYMRALKYNDTGFLDNMLYLALTQDSRHPESIWQMMDNITKNIMGASYNETEFNITYWNTKPLPINTFLQAVSEAAEAAGGEGGGISTLLYGIDTLELLDYLTEKTGTSLGDILDAAGLATFDLVDFIAENIEPTFPPIPLAQNLVSLEQLVYILIPAFVAAPIIAIISIKRKQTGSEISKK
jgi:hypothetical protein